MNRKQLELKLDDICRKIVKKKYRACITCGSSQVETSHLFHRGKKSIRWELKNLAGQCSACNQRHDKEPEHYKNWFIRTYSEEELKNLEAEGNRIAKFTASELQGLIKKLQGYI